MRGIAVFTVPPGAPFLDTVAEALFDGRLVPGFRPGQDPSSLASATIYVPTRRAARALAEALVRRAGTPSLILPRILPLGGLEATETDLLLARDDDVASDPPPAIGEIERRMILTRLILQWGQALKGALVALGPDGEPVRVVDGPSLVATTPAEAWHLSGDLAGLMDEITIEGVAWSALAGLGTERFDDYWRITREFLDIAVGQWPAILASRGVIDRADRRARLVEAEAARLARGRTDAPVIAIGSTGTNAATATLLAAIAHAPHGAVVLPGLDQAMAEATWALIAPDDGSESAAGHPQTAMRRLLPVIGVARTDVTALGTVPEAMAARARFVATALDPAEATDGWPAFRATLSRDGLADALAGITLVEAADEREEALCLALLLRQAADEAGTTALVTPDRQLARRVREETARWGLSIEDTAGQALAETPPGVLARLTLDVARTGLAPLETLALLAHADVRLGGMRDAVERLARHLEAIVLRDVVGPDALASDPAGLVAAARARHDADRRPIGGPLAEADWAALTAMVAALARLFAPWDTVAAHPFAAHLALHRTIVDALAEGPGALATPASERLDALFDTLAETAGEAPDLDVDAYAALFDQMARETVLAPEGGGVPHLAIYGLLEARLMPADTMILAGLDETVWPPAATTDAFLNRPMRRALGLTPPERRIGQTAHDLTQAMGAATVVLARARKRDGAPTVASRFLLRLAALAGPPAWEVCRARGEATLALARALDRPAAVRPIGPPKPRPPVALRPRQLSVTAIETLRRDPYSIYASRILRLSALGAIGQNPGFRELGIGLHDVFAQFVERHPGPPAADALATLEAVAREAFATHFASAAFATLQWPRIARGLEAFLAWHASRPATSILVERSGELPLKLADGSTFTLTARADRIEVQPGGGVALVDFKTGRLPGLEEVKVGFAPQLTLEAVLVQEGGFPELGRPRVVEALYAKFNGPEPVLRPLAWPRDSLDLAAVVVRHRADLIGLLDDFRDVDTAYLAQPFPQFASAYNDYAHLSRIAEWTLGQEQEP